MSKVLKLFIIVGGNERDSAKRRRQDKYREELQLQMREALAAKKRLVFSVFSVAPYCFFSLTFFLQP